MNKNILFSESDKGLELVLSRCKDLDPVLVFWIGTRYIRALEEETDETFIMNLINTIDQNTDFLSYFKSDIAMSNINK